MILQLRHSTGDGGELWSRPLGCWQRFYASPWSLTEPAVRGLNFSVDRLVRRIAVAWLSAIYAGARHWLLVGSIAAFVRIRRDTLGEPWRITDRHSFCGDDRAGILLEPMADQVTLLGGWDARRMGLGTVLSLRRAEQRPGCKRTLVCDSSFRWAAMEWRLDRAGRQHLCDPYHGVNRARRLDRLGPKWAT